MQYTMAIIGMVCLIIGGSNLEYASEFETKTHWLEWIVFGVILIIPLFAYAIKGEK